MLKSVFILFFGLLIFQKANAQSAKDTVVFFLKNSGQMVFIKDSADYIMFNLPADPNTGLYKVVELTRDGKPKLIANSKTRFVIFKKEGTCTDYFPNGKKRSIAIYKDGEIAGDKIDYYPNGKIYTLKTFGPDKKFLLTECRDSIGTVLAEKGNGQWLKFYDDFKNLHEEGPIANGVEDGAWTLILDDKKVGFVYTKGIITTPINYDLSDRVFLAPDIEPEFKGGASPFNTFLSRNISYPKEDRENNVQGKVFVSFIVERDGALTNIKADKSPSKTLAAEAIKALKQSPPWKPGYVGGAPVRTSYTIPVNFTLSKDN